MSDYDENGDWVCTFDEDGECDNPECGERKDYDIEIVRTVVYTVRAHTEDEATNSAYNVDIAVMQNVTDDCVDDFNEGDNEIVVTDAAEAREQERQWYESLHKAMDEEETHEPG